jgi:hypothetical protein
VEVSREYLGARETVQKREGFTARQRRKGQVFQAEVWKSGIESLSGHGGKQQDGIG